VARTTLPTTSTIPEVAAPLPYRMSGSVAPGDMTRQRPPVMNSISTQPHRTIRGRFRDVGIARAMKRLATPVSSSRPSASITNATRGEGILTAQPRDTNRRGWIAGAAAAAVVVICLASVTACNSEPPPDEDAYVDALFTSKWDVLLPKRPFIDEGYAACDLLRQEHTEEQATQIMYERDTSTGTIPEKVLERYRQQTVAAHAHLCPGA
jgi:hypothetical protein